MSSLIFVVFMAFGAVKVNPLLGGPKDKPIVWRVGGNYHLLRSETYWSEAMPGFVYENTPGGYVKMDFTLFRFGAPDKYKYSRATHKHLEFVRKLQAFLHPKGLYVGYYGGIYDLKGTHNNLELQTRVLTPGGISLGVFCGKLPLYPYFSVSAGASLVTEKWDILGESGIMESTGFWGTGRGGLLWQLRAHFALDVSVTYSYLTRRPSEGAEIPEIAITSGVEEEIIQEIRVGVGLVFAMPWIVEKTVY